MRLVPLLPFLPLAACVPPPVTLTAEQAYPLCQQAALPELRRTLPTASAASLDPLDAVRVERRALPVTTAEGVSLVIAGRGSSTAPSTSGSFRYTCLLGTRGKVVWLGVEQDAASEVVAECQGVEASVCLGRLSRAAEADLAQAEAEALKAARVRDGTRAEIDEPAAVSIGAWRVYRDAECGRRAGADVPKVSACRIELTRRRVRELRG